MKGIKRVICLLLVVLFLCTVPFAANAATPTENFLTGITVSGFTVPEFTKTNHYYQCYPTVANWTKCKITKLTVVSRATYDIAVEQYCSYVTHPDVGDTLDLSYGRARVTVTVTLDKVSETYLFALTDPRQDSYYYAYVGESANVRKSASDSSAVVEFRKVDPRKKETNNASMLFCVGTSGEWTHVVLPGASKAGKEGWIETKKLIRGFTTVNMPSAYKEKLNDLQKAHPNWHFEFVHMDTDMQSYAEKIRSQLVSDLGGTKNVPEITEIISYMDPSHYFDEKLMLAFLQLDRYQPSHYTADGIRSIWVTRSTPSSCTKEQAAVYFIDAGKSLKLNPYFLCSRAGLETGYGTSKLALGKPGSDGKIYYNYYGIGAYDTDPGNGATYAQKRGWSTVPRAITEGGNWINDQYIQRGQNTMYFLRYYTLREHSYMTSLDAADSESKMIWKGYNGSNTLDKDLYFTIPVYDGYKDVPATAWYFNDVMKATEYGLFSGMGDGTFAPETALTRAQFVTVLARIAGAKTKDYVTRQFSDVKSGAWYAGAVAWAFKSGITKGVEEHHFCPDDHISRQQLCTMLARFAECQDITMSDGTPKFKDNDKIASWAFAAVGKCVKAKLVSGLPDGTFDPTGDATRAQSAKILRLFYEMFAK